MTSVPSVSCTKHLVEISTMKELRKWPDLQEGDLLKIRFKLSADDYDKWAGMKADIQKWGTDNNYQIELIQPIMDIKPRTYKKVDVQSVGQLIKTFGKRFKVSNDILSTGLKLLED